MYSARVMHAHGMHTACTRHARGRPASHCCWAGCTMRAPLRTSTLCAAGLSSSSTPQAKAQAQPQPQRQPQPQPQPQLQPQPQPQPRPRHRYRHRHRPQRKWALGLRCGCVDRPPSEATAAYRPRSPSCCAPPPPRRRASLTRLSTLTADLGTRSSGRSSSRSSRRRRSSSSGGSSRDSSSRDSSSRGSGIGSGRRLPMSPPQPPPASCRGVRSVTLAPCRRCGSLG